MTQVMVQINGNAERVPEGTSIKSLLLDRNINPNVVACELNMTVIRRAELDQVKLKEGDVLEVIRMIGGG
jgi:thiamine biosynthesis protein ThiS